MQPCCASEQFCNNVGDVDKQYRAISHGHGHLDANKHAHSNQHFHANVHAYTDANGYRYHPHADGNHHPYGHLDGDEHAYGNANHHSHGHHDANSHPLPQRPLATPTVTATPSPTNTPTPTSTPTPTPCDYLIRNGGFETIGDWTIGNTPRPAEYSTAVVRTDSWAMRLGITDLSDAKSYSSVYQEVTIPEDAARGCPVLLVLSPLSGYRRVRLARGENLRPYLDASRVGDGENLLRQPDLDVPRFST